MAGRNMDPVIFAGVEHGSKATIEAGVKRADANVIITERDFQRLKDGRVCPKCWEVQSRPFPETCELAAPDGTLLCSFPIRRYLAKFLEEEIDGYTTFRRPSPDDARAASEELRRRRLQQSGVWFPE